MDMGDAMSLELSKETRTKLCALTTMLSSYQVSPGPCAGPCTHLPMHPHPHVPPLPWHSLPLLSFLHTRSTLIS